MNDAKHDERFVTHSALLLGVSFLLIGIVIYAYRKKSVSSMPQAEIERLAALIDL